jgi:UPF0176 protein
MSSESLQHLSFYRFTPLGDENRLRTLRDELRFRCRGAGLTGTVLLAHEGVNAMVTGTPGALETLLHWARSETGLTDAECKRHPVTGHAFRRMLVKIKREIIPVGDPALRPDLRTAPRVDAATLKRWLDEGRDVVLLDTRNAYEIEVGTFRGAVNLGLDHSREFADRAARAAPDWRDRTVVAFCTGGIRCEKASAVLMDLGLRDVHQLDGGILRYFEVAGGAHYQGDCFVFDEREAVRPDLSPAPRSDDPTRIFGRHVRPDAVRAEPEGA